MAISRSYAGGGGGIRRRTTQPRSMFDQFFLEADQGLFGGKPMSAPPANTSAPMGAPPAGTGEPLVGFPAGVTGPFGPNSNPTMGAGTQPNFTTNSQVPLSGPPSVPGSPAFRYGDRSFVTSDVASGPDTGVGQTGFTVPSGGGDSGPPPPPPPEEGAGSNVKTVDLNAILASSRAAASDMLPERPTTVVSGGGGGVDPNAGLAGTNTGMLNDFFAQADAGEELMAAIRRDPMAFRGAGIGNWRSQSGLSAMDLPQEIQNQVNTFLGSDDYRNLLGSDPRYQAEQRARELEAENASLRASISANPAQTAPTMTNVAATQGERVDSAPTTTAVSPVETLSSASAPSDAAARATGGASDRELREQQMQMIQSAIGRGETFGQNAISGLRDFNIANAGLQFNLPAATSREIGLDRFTPTIATQNINLDPVNFDAQAQQASLAAINPNIQAQAQSLAAFNPTMSAQNIALNDYNSNVQAQNAALNAMNERIALGEFAPTAGASDFETQFGNLLLGRIENANAMGGAGNPQTAALLADLENTASRQRERDIAQLNRLGVLQSGNTVDVFEEGNQNLRRDRLSALAQGYALSQNDPALQAAIDLAGLASNRGITGDAQRLQARGQDLTAGQSNLEAVLGARGQDLSAALANQQANLDAQRFNEQQALAARGQDLSAAELNQLANLRAQESQADARLRGREQDRLTALANQQADLDAQRANLDAILTGRQQDSDIALANQAAGLDAQRLNLEALLTGRDQDLTAGLSNQASSLQGQIAAMNAGLTARDQDLRGALANQAADLDAQRLNVDQQFGIADRQLADAARVSADERFAADLGLRQLQAQQDLADRVTSRQLLQGGVTDREQFEEGVRQARVGEGQFTAELQNRLDQIGAQSTADQALQNILGRQSLSQLAAQGTNQRLLQDLVNQGALGQLSQQGTNQQALQRILGQQALSQIGAQGTSDRLLQALVNQGNVEGLQQQGTNAEALQRILGQQAISQIGTQGTNDRLLQALVNQGNIGSLQQQGTNATALQELVNQGVMDQTTANNLLQQNLATGQFGDRQTLESLLTNQQVNFANQLMPSQLEAANIANRDASSLIDERNIGQFIALAQAVPEDQRNQINQTIANMLSGSSTNAGALLNSLFQRPSAANFNSTPTNPVDPINPDQTALTPAQLEDILTRVNTQRRDMQGNAIPFGFPNLGAYQNLIADLANLRGL